MAYELTIAGQLAAVRASLGVAPYDCIVDAAGLGTHTTLQAAITAAPAGGRIYVASDLTIAPAAGTVAFEITKNLTIDFSSGPGGALRRIKNTGDGDVFGSGVALSSTDQVNGVKIIRPYIEYTGANGSGRSLGRAFNMHGTWNWDIENPYISGHAVGIYMDAGPGVTGQCSHNVFRHSVITACGIAVHNTVNANANSWVDTKISNCDVHIDHTSGLNPCFEGLTCENLSGILTPLIYGRSSGLKITGLHMEAKASVGAITLEAASTGTIIDGDVYNQGGGTRTAIANGARYSLRLSNSIIAEHGSNRGSREWSTQLANCTITDTFIIAKAQVEARVKAISLIPSDYVNYSGGNFWTIDFKEYNGNTLVGTIATITQAAQIGLAGVAVTGLDWTLTQDRVIRAVFTKAGAPTTIYQPIVQVEYDVDPG